MGSAAGNTPFWNGSSWITSSSNIFNNGASVGIGTTTPQVGLEVDIAVGATYAKFGATNPVYIVANSPMVGFNAWWPARCSAPRTEAPASAAMLTFNQELSGGFVFDTAPSGTATRRRR